MKLGSGDKAVVDGNIDVAGTVAVVLELTRPEGIPEMTDLLLDVTRLEELGLTGIEELVELGCTKVTAEITDLVLDVIYLEVIGLTRVEEVPVAAGLGVFGLILIEGLVELACIEVPLEIIDLVLDVINLEVVGLSRVEELLVVIVLKALGLAVIKELSIVTDLDVVALTDFEDLLDVANFEELLEISICFEELLDVIGLEVLDVFFVLEELVFEEPTIVLLFLIDVGEFDEVGLFVEDVNTLEVFKRLVDIREEDKEVVLLELVTNTECVELKIGELVLECTPKDVVATIAGNRRPNSTG